ncbi:MAG TPA: GNAT family N-acetyltransferase [Dehalococcoidia bacterium]|nr:GNAT family N-acetyltransferase [Dehalococcoidia bacterium]
MTVDSRRWTEAAMVADEGMMALANERFQAEGATFIRNRQVPHIRDANHVRNVRASTPGELERLLSRMEEEFAGFPHRCFRVDYRTPPLLEARLALEGYKRGESLFLVLAGEPAGGAKPHDIRPLESESDWRAYARLRQMDWQEYVGKQGRAFDDTEARAMREMVEVTRAKCPPLRYWLGYVDGEPCAYLCSWEGIDGVGQVEDVFTHPEYRGRGLAKALLHHAVADCRAHGAGPVTIVADPGDTPKQIYASMGFRPVSVQRVYWRMVEA